MKFSQPLLRCSLATVFVLLASMVAADDQPAEKTVDDPFAKQRFKPPVGLNRFIKDRDIWLDAKRKRVVIDGVVALRDGQLEMFACPIGTKEHESVIAVNCTAKQAHAGLLLVGAFLGRPAKFEPEYSPATGSIIDIMILWHDKDGKKRSTKAQNWVRNVKTREPMKYDWVFAGSGVWVDPDTGETFYHADSGDFICVSNFPSATLDVPVESPQANASLRYESFTEKVPERGTPVRLVLTPRPPKKVTRKQDSTADKGKKAGKKQDAKKDQPSRKKTETPRAAEKKTAN